MKILLTVLIFVSSALYANDITLADLRIDGSNVNRTVASEQERNCFSTRNLAWMTMALLGATGLTGQEKDASTTHTALASLTAMSYGAFLNSYMKDPVYTSVEGQAKYKWASYSKWLHIPSMIMLPVAGILAQRQFQQGDNSAHGFAATHKPAALASVVSMALATLSLTFEF